MTTGFVHRINDLDTKTHGFLPRSMSTMLPRTLRPAFCTYCKGSLLVESSGMDHSKSNITIISRLSGPANVIVISVLCVKCENISGGTAPENRCVSGGENVWVEIDLINEQRCYYNASNYSLSDESLACSYLKSCELLGWTGSSGMRTVTTAIKRATQVYIGTEEEDRKLCCLPGVADLQSCPACAHGCLALHCDCDFKLKGAPSRTRPHASPMVSTTGVDMWFDSKTDTLRNLEMDRFRAYRHAPVEDGGLSIPRTSVPYCSDCPDLRAAGDPKSKSGAFSYNATSYCVCRHNVANVGLCLLVDTRGEGLEYAHFAVRKALHMSGQLPLVKVFGDLPDVRWPKTSIFYSDMPCQLIPHLRKHDTIPLELLEIKLGEVHKYSHVCQLANSGSYCTGAACSSGENCESYWSRLNPMAHYLEHCGPTALYETIAFATLTENEKSMEATPDLFGRMGGRAVVRFAEAMGKLDALLHAIYHASR